MKSRLVAALAALTLALPVWAQHSGHGMGGGMMGGSTMEGGMTGGGMSSQSADHGAKLAEGEVRRVDKEAGRITLKHGAIPSLDMPAMTMAYRVKDAAMLEGLRPGDRIKFSAEHTGDAITVTSIEPAR